MVCFAGVALRAGTAFFDSKQPIMSGAGSVGGDEGAEEDEEGRCGGELVAVCDVKGAGGRKGG